MSTMDNLHSITISVTEYELLTALANRYLSMSGLDTTVFIPLIKIREKYSKQKADETRNNLGDTK